MTNLEVAPPIPKKAKTKSKYKDKKAAQGKPVKEVAQELLDKVQSLKALVNCHSLIKEGAYPFIAHGTVHASLNFLETLHKTVLEDALKHPDAMLVPKLKEHVLAEAANGKK